VITGLLVTIFLYFCFERQGLGASSGPADTLETRASGTLLRTARDLVVANVTESPPLSWDKACCSALDSGLSTFDPRCCGALSADWLRSLPWREHRSSGAFVVGSTINSLRPLLVGSREKQHPVLLSGGDRRVRGPRDCVGPVLVSLTAGLIEEMQELLPKDPVAGIQAQGEPAAAVSHNKSSSSPADAAVSPRHNRQEPLRRTTAPDRMSDRIFCTGYTQWRVLTAVRRRRFLRDRPKRRRDLIQMRPGKLSERDVSLGPCVRPRKQLANSHALKLYERADWDAFMHSHYVNAAVCGSSY
jgi:hypothetical protein